jgi:NitT/TauT family transport system substrate-binding protein
MIMARLLARHYGRWLLLGLIAAMAAGCAAPAPAERPAAPERPAPAAAAAAASPSPPSPPPATRLKVGYAAFSGSSWPVWIAQDAGLFAAHGLEVDLEYVPSSTTAMQAMLGGDLPIAHALTAPTVIHAVLSGADAVLIAATGNTVLFKLMVTPDVRDLTDLRGRRLGVSRFGSSSDTALRYALGQWGLRPAEDVVILQMGGIPEILAGMQGGSIHGGPLSSPTDLRARQAGYRELADLSTIGFEYPQTTTATTRAFLRANEDVVRRYLRAVVEATHFLKTEPARSQQIFGKYTDTSDPAFLESSYESYADKTEAVPYLRPSALQVAIAEVAQTDPRAKDLNLDDVADNRYVQELESSGFAQRLYGR